MVFLPPPGWLVKIEYDIQFVRKSCMLLPQSDLLDAVLNWMIHGLVDFSGWQVLITALVFTHITIASVTIYLHRHSAHRSLDLHPIPSHFFRFWLWLTTGQVTKEWTAVHRKHHAKCEQA